MTGSHTWNDFQDWGTNGTPEAFDFTGFVTMMASHNQNFTLLWQTELAHFCGMPTTATSVPAMDVGQLPWLRTGPGNATDGKPKFDLTRFDPSYFQRLRTRVQQLNAAGIYAGVYAFSGQWLSVFRCGGDGYPLSGAKNINSIDDGGARAL